MPRRKDGLCAQLVPACGQTIDGPTTVLQQQHGFWVGEVYPPPVAQTLPHPFELAWEDGRAGQVTSPQGRGRGVELDEEIFLEV